MLSEKKMVAGREITLSVQFVGADLHLFCTGGDLPHIGAVSVATPHGTENTLSVSVSTITLPEHRDDTVSMALARRFSKELGVVVVACCGIHYDDFSAEVLAFIQQSVDELSGLLLCRLNEERSELI